MAPLPWAPSHPLERTWGTRVYACVCPHMCESVCVRMQVGEVEGGEHSRMLFASAEVKNELKIRRPRVSYTCRPRKLALSLFTWQLRRLCLHPPWLSCQGPMAHLSFGLSLHLAVLHVARPLPASESYRVRWGGGGIPVSENCRDFQRQ